MTSQTPPPDFDAYMALNAFLFARGRQFSGTLDEWLAAQPYSAEQEEAVRLAYVASGGQPERTDQAPRWP
jgi:hypothetical protein